MKLNEYLVNINALEKQIYDVVGTKLFNSLGYYFGYDAKGFNDILLTEPNFVRDETVDLQTDLYNYLVRKFATALPKAILDNAENLVLFELFGGDDYIIIERENINNVTFSLINMGEANDHPDENGNKPLYYNIMFDSGSNDILLVGKIYLSQDDESKKLFVENMKRSDSLFKELISDKNNQVIKLHDIYFNSDVHPVNRV